VLDVNAWARDPAKFGEALQRNDLPTAKKESQKWLRGYAAADRAAERLGPKTQVVVVGDREADMFELLDAAKKGRAGLLVRAVHPRRILSDDGGSEGRLWDCVCAMPAAGSMEVEIPRRGARPARRATLELRFRPVRVARPQHKPGGGKAARSVAVWAIAATESAESAGDGEPIEWLLLTTLKVADAESAAEKVRWYRQRWQIEVFHRTLKTGCKVERRQATTAETLKAALAIDVVVACRVMALVKLGRETPDLPCSILFEEDEWKGLHCYVNRTRTPPEKPPSLRTMLRMIAQLGGFLGRKSDGDPGTETTWRGMEHLATIATAFQIFFSSA
jgi:hypothetical protein